MVLQSGAFETFVAGLRRTGKTTFLRNDLIPALEPSHALAHVMKIAPGLPRDHIATQMRAFRDGKRPATVMHQIAKGYTDEQVKLMAAYFAAQPARK